MNNKWTRAAIPALLIHCSVGTVYCWSTFKESIANQIGMSPFAVGWAFSLAIFFLGMSAAFAGKLVEKNIHKSSLVSCLCFSFGMISTGAVIQFASGWLALLGIYICYGVIMGIGLGVGYLTPVKTLMLWFEDKKGLATGISIMGFGLAKAIATPIMELIQNTLGIAPMFYILGAAYFILMYIGHLLLKKPEGWVEPKVSSFNVKTMFREKQFIGIWLMFYLNIHCGLMVISYEKQIIASVMAFVGIATIIPSITAGFNAFGRIGYSTISDRLRERNTIYKVIFISSIVATVSALLFGTVPTIIIATLIIINAGYGGGFSTLPALLCERFGIKNISQIHGLALSAWAIAGLTGNNTTAVILSYTSNYKPVFIVASGLYLIALVISVTMVRKKTSKSRGIFH